MSYLFEPMLKAINKFIGLQDELNYLVPNYCLKNLTPLTGKTVRLIGL